MSIDWSKAPEGATHFISTSAAKYWFKKVGDNFYAYNGTGWNAKRANPSCVSMREMFEIPRPASTGKPKPLTQAVFDGLPPEYLWAAVDEDGETYAHAVKPECHFYSGRWVQPIIRGSLALFGGDHDATDWQNSLIERQEVSNRVEQLRSIEEARQVEATLAERQGQYGDFSKVAGVSQHLQSVIWAAGADFDDVQQEAIQMICSKLARLACGDADHVDSWHDIAGYATLVVKDLESAK